MSEISLEARSVDIDILEILRRGPKEWNQWREENPFVSIDLSHAQLSQAQLNGANLNGVNLSSADLSHADLRLAELRGVNLKSADLNRTQLHGADLNSADLSNASLIQARLNGVDLSHANLSNANLSQAGLSNVNLSEADLRGTNLNKAYFNNVHFSGTKLGIINLVRYHSKAIWKNLSAIPAQGYHNFEVRIFDTQIHPVSLENLQSAIALFASHLGYEIVATIQSVNASFLKDIRYKVARSLAPEINNEGIKSGFEWSQKESSQIENLGIQSIQRTAQAKANVLNAIEDFDEIVLLLGQLVIIKYIDDQGNSNLFTKTIPLKLQKQLASSPTLLDSPQAFINFLNDRAGVADQCREKQFVFAQTTTLGMA